MVKRDEVVLAGYWRSPDGKDYRIQLLHSGRLVLARWWTKDKTGLVKRGGHYHRIIPRIRDASRLWTEARAALRAAAENERRHNQ